MLKLAYEHNPLVRMPVLRKLEESAPRQGFFEADAFAAVRRRLSPDLQVAVTIAPTSTAGGCSRKCWPSSSANLTSPLGR